MADLGRRADGRGQLLLLGAFALAALFVTLALILNVVIYTENLATRADSRTSDAVAHSQSVERATVDLLRYVNENTTDSTYSDLKDEFGVGLSNFTTGAARFQLTSGVVINGTNRTEFEGTWLTQTNESRNFTNKRNESSWSPVNGSANGARSFRFKVRDASTDLVSLGSNPFTVRASDGTDEWVLEVGSDDVRVTDADGNTETTETNTTASGSVWINVSDGTVNGTAWEALDFGGDLETIDSIEFENAGNVVGTYRLMVNKTRLNVDDEGKDYEPGPTKEAPFKQSALYGAVVGIDYETTTLAYRTERRVVPGETDG